MFLQLWGGRANLREQSHGLQLHVTSDPCNPEAPDLWDHSQSWPGGLGDSMEAHIFPLYLCFCSVAKLCPPLCDPMVCSTPGFPVLHHLPEYAQTPVHWLHDAIQPSHPLWSPSPPAFNLSQHQGLFQWVSSSHQVAIVLGFSFSFSPSNEHSGLICLRISLQSNRPSRVFSNTADPKHQFFGAQPSLWSNSYTHTRLLEKP